MHCVAANGFCCKTHLGYFLLPFQLLRGPTGPVDASQKVNGIERGASDRRKNRFDFENEGKDKDTSECSIPYYRNRILKLHIVGKVICDTSDFLKY
jgi:hypothetical protein